MCSDEKRHQPEPPPGQPVKVSFKYNDFDGGFHRFDCTIDSDFYQHENSAFGFPVDHEALWHDLDDRLTDRIRSDIESVVHWSKIKVDHKLPEEPVPAGGFLWSYRLHWEVAKAEEGIFINWKDENLARVSNEVAVSYFAEKGFELLPGQTSNKNSVVGSLEIDYERLASEARTATDDCYDRFVREAGAGSREEILRLLVAAFQELCYQRPPQEEDHLYKGELWVPAQVLGSGKSDCDSSAVAFFSFWQRTGVETVLLVEDLPIKLREKLPLELQIDNPDPKHALLGVNATRVGKQSTARVGLRDFVLFETLPLNPKLQVGDRLPAGKVARTVCMTDDCWGTSMLY